ncbi:FAD-dependent oxidoreductase [Streptomyces mexicanus]
MTERHVAVIGAGPAGLAAAEAALSAGARVTLIDSADRPGGQYHRMLPDAYHAARPERLQHGWQAFDRRRRRVLAHPRCAWWPETSVWALERPDATEPGVPRVHVLRGAADGGRRRRLTLDADALVLAVGAHDRVLPFPGWELPGVFAAGAAQALAKGERVVVGDQVVVAGTGPFLLPVAASLLEAGSRVLQVLEAGTVGTLARGWARRPWELAAQLGKTGELAAYAALLVRHGVPFRAGRGVVEARGDGRVEEVVTARLRADWSVVPGTERTLAVDAVCVTHGFTPSWNCPWPRAVRCAAHGAVSSWPWTTTSAPAVRASTRPVRSPVSPVPRRPARRARSPDGSPAAATRPCPPCARCAAAGTRAAPSPNGWPRRTRSERSGRDGCAPTPSCAAVRRPTTPRCAGPPATRRAPAHVSPSWRHAPASAPARHVCGPTVAELTARLTGRPPERAFEGLPAAGPHHRPIAQPIRLGELAAAPEPSPDHSTPQAG